MKKLLVLIILAVALPAFAGGLQASFLGSKLPEARSSMIFRYDGTVDGSGNLIDTSGENLLTYSEAFGSWASLVRLSVVSNQYKNPLSNTLTADVLHEDNSAATSHAILSQPSTTSGNKYTFSVYGRSINRRWLRIEIGGAVQSHVDFTNCVNGTLATGGWASVSQETKRVNNQWCQAIVKFNSGFTGVTNVYLYIAEADNDATFDGLDQDSVVVYGAQLVDNTDGFIVGPGIYHTTTSVTKPRLDLAPTGAPPSAQSHLQGSNGNRMSTRSFNGTTQGYRRAMHDSVKYLFGTDHTLIVVYSKYAAGFDSYLFSTLFSTGMNIETFNGTVYIQYYTPNASIIYAGNAYNTYYTIQITRSGDVLSGYANGVFLGTLNVAGRGTSNASFFSIGMATGAASFFHNGDILYVAADNRSLNATELLQDRQQIEGVLAGHKGRTSW